MEPENTTPNGQEPTSETGNESNVSEERTFSAEYVAELRAENAKWRTKLREVEGKIEAFETLNKKRQEQELTHKEEWKTLAEQRQQELEKLQQQIRAQSIQQTKLEVVAELGLPADVVKFLVGDDVETIKASAEEFKNLLPKAPTAGSQTRATTTVVPGGEPSTETREQKMRRIYGNGGIF